MKDSETETEAANSMRGDATAIPLWLKTRDFLYVNVFYDQRQERRARMARGED